MIVRVRYKRLGGHTHLRVFVGSSRERLDLPGALSGELVLTNDEVGDFRRALHDVEWINEDSKDLPIMCSGTCARTVMVSTDGTARNAIGWTRVEEVAEEPGIERTVIRRSFWCPECWANRSR